MARPDPRHQGALTLVPGTTKLLRLQENTAAAEVELSADDKRRIADVLAGIQVQGDRYPPHLAALVGR